MESPVLASWTRSYWQGFSVVGYRGTLPVRDGEGRGKGSFFSGSASAHSLKDRPSGTCVRGQIFFFSPERRTQSAHGADPAEFLSSRSPTRVNTSTQCRSSAEPGGVPPPLRGALGGLGCPHLRAAAAAPPGEEPSTRAARARRG